MNAPDDAADEQLLAALAAALDAVEQPPADAVDVAIAAGSVHAVDAHALQLLFDSAAEDLVASRANDAPARLLTFALDEIVVELEVSRGPSVLRGIVSPADRYDIELVQGTNRVVKQTNELGYFEMAMDADSPFRLAISHPSRRTALAIPWIEDAHG